MGFDAVDCTVQRRFCVVRCLQHIHVDGSGGVCGPGKDADGKGDGNGGGGGGGKGGGISTVESESSSCVLVSGAYAAPAPSSSNPPVASNSSTNMCAATTIRGTIIAKSNAVNAPDASVNGSGTMSTLMSGTMTHVTGSVWPGGTPFGSSGTDPTRSIHLLHLLGSGSFGRVYYGKRHRCVGEVATRLGCASICLGSLVVHRALCPVKSL